MFTSAHRIARFPTELLASDRLPKLKSITIYLDVKGYTRPNSERQTYIVYDVLALLPQVRASGRALVVETKQSTCNPERNTMCGLMAFV